MQNSEQKSNKEVTESKILELVKQIQAIVMKYNPEDDYFIVSISPSAIYFNNTYWNWEDPNKQLRFSEVLK